MVDVLTATTTEPEARVRPHTRPAIIDCDVHNELDSIKDLYPYLSQRWRDHIDTFGLQGPTGGYFNEDGPVPW